MGFAWTIQQCSFIQTEQPPQSDDDPDVVPDPLVVREKIKTAFSKIDKSNLKGVIQFWAPVIQNNGRRVLSTLDQPCTYQPTFDTYRNYKMFSMMYYYNIDDTSKFKKEEGVVLDNGAQITAFLNHLPEIVMDLSEVVRDVDQFRAKDRWWHVLRHALHCDLRCYMMLPVFYYPSSSSCVGVVECFLEFPAELPIIFTKLRLALKGVGLSMFHVQESRPYKYKTLPCFNRTIYEIEEALEIICKSHDVTVAQVWIPYEIQNHAPFTSSFLEATQTKQAFSVKLIGYCVDSDDGRILSNLKAYYDACDTLPLEAGEGLVGKTLESYEPYFCRNIYELRRANGWRRNMKLFETPIKCSSLVICLRSIDTGDIDYAFEFLWSCSRNYLILSESLLLTLKRCLPSFKLASGAELGDELRVFDVGNSTGVGIGFFNLLKENRLSPIPKALEKRRSLVADEGCISSSNVKWKATPIPSPQFGRSLNEPARSFTGLQRPNFVRRKLNDMPESESDSNDEEHQHHKTNQDILAIKVEHVDDVFNLHLPVSLATIVAVKKEINEICNINHGTYKLKYLDEDDEWILMNSDTHLRHCITSWRIAGGTHILMRVVPLIQ